VKSAACWRRWGFEGTVDEVPRRVLKEQLGDYLEGETKAAKAKRQDRNRGEADANRRWQP